MPDFIKVDRSLISGIDHNDVKMSILEAFVTFTQKMNSQVIAEGIETEAELKKVMDLGIHFGQGFFLARPNNPVSPIYEEERSIIKNKQISSYKQSKSVTVNIHDEIVLVEKGSIVTRKMARDLFQV